MSAELTILCWFWTQPGGRTSYTAAHVNIWAAMVRRNLTIPHRIACVTRETDGIDPRVDIIEPPGDFEDVRIPSWGGRLPQCLRRIALFRPDAAAIFGPRFVSMDIDCVVTRNLDSLFDRPDEFVMYRGTTGRRPYNGSMLMLTAGARSQVYTDFTPEGAVEAGQQYVGSDQAWIAYKLGWGEPTWGVEHGVLWHGAKQRTRLTDHPPRLVFFPGIEKPWQIIDDPLVAKHYRGDRTGRCLILGYSPDVWGEAEAAMRAGPVDAIIASPEVAEHWRGDLLAVAYTDDEAEQIAAMHGFREIVFCGRTLAAEEEAA